MVLKEENINKYLKGIDFAKFDNDRQAQQYCIVGMRSGKQLLNSLLKELELFRREKKDGRKY